MLRGLSNHFWNSSHEEKIFGSRKFRRAHNSLRLFYRGVPVNSTLWADWYCWPRVRANFDF